MVGQRTATKPSRSDEVLDAEEQIKIADQIRSQFESIAPKRPLKPSRSEPENAAPTDDVAVDDKNIPELLKFQSLQSHSPPSVVFSANDRVGDEFVETEYYGQLQSIDKQHHTTGNGFIRVVREGGEDDVIQQLRSSGTTTTIRRSGGGNGGAGFRSNPATNEWVPSLEEED